MLSLRLRRSFKPKDSDVRIPVANVPFNTSPQTLNAKHLTQMEHGATRNYEIWNDRKEDEEGQRAEREADEEGDAMKALENRLVLPLSLKT